MTGIEFLHSFSLACMHCMVYFSQCLSFILAKVLFLKDAIRFYVFTQLANAFRPPVLSFSKLPKSLAFVFEEEQTSLADVVRLIEFSAIAGIQQLMFYDASPADILCMDLGEVFNTEESNGKLGKALTNNIVISMCHFDTVFLNGVKLNTKTCEGAKSESCKSNLCRTGQSLSITVLPSHQDGRQQLASVAMDIASDVKNGLCTVDDVNGQLISRKVKERRGVMDPEFMLIFGPIYSTFGFSPWNLRLTEFMLVTDVKSFDEQRWWHCMKKYSSREQRLGK